MGAVSARTPPPHPAPAPGNRDKIPLGLERQLFLWDGTGRGGVGGTGWGQERRQTTLLATSKREGGQAPSHLTKIPPILGAEGGELRVSPSHNRTGTGQRRAIGVSQGSRRAGKGRKEKISPALARRLGSPLRGGYGSGEGSVSP